MQNRKSYKRGRASPILKWMDRSVGVFSSLTKMEFQPSTLTCLRMQQVESADMLIIPFTSLLSGQVGRVGNAY